VKTGNADSELLLGGAAGERITRFVSAAIAAVVVLLVATELGFVPLLDYQWGVTLWQYLPTWATYLLAAATLPLCAGSVRRAILRAGEKIPLTRALGWGALVAIPIVLFVLRERLAFGDSRILYYTMNANPAVFFFPDLGATFFLQVGHRIGEATGIGGLELVQGFICCCAALAVYFFWRAARLLTESPGEAVAVVALVLATGIVRGFAGHLEVYSFVLVTAGAGLTSDHRSSLSQACSRSWVWPASTSNRKKTRVGARLTSPTGIQRRREWPMLFRGSARTKSSITLGARNRNWICTQSPMANAIAGASQLHCPRRNAKLAQRNAPAVTSTKE
jgi:hypothetical protein